MNSRYIGTHAMHGARSLDECKKKFYRAANGIFGKIGRTASEDVILKLISSKCIPILPGASTPLKHGRSLRPLKMRGERKSCIVS